MTQTLFEVDLKPFEPHSVQNRPGNKFSVKESYRDAIIRKLDSGEIEEARHRLKGKALKVDIVFYLWKGAPNITDTRAKKDLDNLLKPVLDALQMNLDARGTRLGLRLIENDSNVFEIHALKKLVDHEEDEGINITISEYGKGWGDGVP